MTTLPADLVAGKSDLDAAALAFLARRAWRAYDSRAEIARALEAQGGTLVDFWDVGVTEAYLATFARPGEDKPAFAVLAFRGTEIGEWRDFATDFKIRKRAMTNTARAVHRGFAAGLDGPWRSIKAALRSLIRVRIPVYVTGHSKGAAEAILAAWRWDKFRALVTFGAPRVGNAAFAEAMANDAGAVPHHRVVHGCDPVPWVPLLSLGYRHACPAIVLDDHGLRGAQGVVAHLRAAIADWRPGPLLGWRGMLRRHSAACYTAALDAVAAAEAREANRG